MIVYRGMDRHTLDAAYNNSVVVADSDQYLASWLRRSEALRARMPDHLDLVYGDAPRTRLDFFATNRTAAPTLLFFHGGYWQRNAKEQFANLIGVVGNGEQHCRHGCRRRCLACTAQDNSRHCP